MKLTLFSFVKHGLTFSALLISLQSCYCFMHTISTAGIWTACVACNLLGPVTFVQTGKLWGVTVPSWPKGYQYTVIPRLWVAASMWRLQQVPAQHEQQLVCWQFQLSHGLWCTPACFRSDLKNSLELGVHMHCQKTCAVWGYNGYYTYYNMHSLNLSGSFVDTKGEWKKKKKSFACIFVCLILNINVLGADRQSSVYANSSSRNIAPKRKTVPNESTTCIGFTAIKKVWYWTGTLKIFKDWHD